MGYEVLDSDGERSALPGGSLPPPDQVVAFDELPSVPSEADTAPPDDPPSAHRDRYPARWLRNHTAWIVAAVAIIGLAAGTLWSNHHHEQVQSAQDRGSVKALALSVNVSPLTIGQGRVADFTVRIFNIGAHPLTIDVSGRDARASRTTPIISIVSGNGLIAPGADDLVVARIAVDCTSDRPIQVAIPVRSVDGTIHKLSLHDGNGGAMTQTPVSLCTFNQGQQALEADLGGTIDRPVIQLHNNVDQPLTVQPASGASLLSSAVSVITVSTEPELPVMVRPRDTVFVLLKIKVRACITDLARFTGDGSSSFVGLRVLTRDGQDAAFAGVDIGPAIGAALSQACERPAAG